MNPDQFRASASAMLEEIPSAYQAGIDAVVVQEDALTYPALPGVLTMGECITEEWPDGLGGSETRSKVVLYYGSFRALSEVDPAFDWDAELWETLLHELLHHREAAASEAGLELFDWAVEQDYRRHAGEPFDPGFYRVLPRDADGVVRIESEIFLQVALPPRAREAVFEWRGHRFRVPVPVEGDPLYVNIRNLASGRLWVVAWRHRNWWQRTFGRRPFEPGHLLRRALPAPT